MVIIADNMLIMQVGLIVDITTCPEPKYKQQGTGWWQCLRTLALGRYLLVTMMMMMQSLLQRCWRLAVQL